MKNTLEILNVKCGGCANSVKKGLMSIEGIENIEVDIEKGIVSFDAASNDSVNLAKEKLSNMGYPENGDANTIMHKAKSFVSCATGKMGSKE